MWGDCLYNTPENTQIATIACVIPLFQNLLTAAFVFSGITTLILIMFSAIKFLTSGGDPKQVEGARNTLTYAIIGLIIVVLSFAILNLVAMVTGVKCITSFGFTNCQ